MSGDNNPDEQPGEAINRIVFNLRAGAGSSSSSAPNSMDLFDDRALFTTTRRETTDPPATSSSSSSASRAAGVDGLKNEFESLGILTQLIGPPKKIHNNLDVDSQPGDLPKGQKEANRFKDVYLAKTDQLDKMRAHHESLSRAVARGKLPMKLRIGVKPVVADSDCPKFQKNWREAIRSAERSMVKTLTDHLADKIETTNHQIRESAERTFVALRSTANLSPQETEELLKNTLNEAETDRKARNEARQKRKMEAMANQRKNQNATKKPRRE